MFAEAKNTTIM